MGRHFHSNSKALWETEPLGGGATRARIFASMATTVWGGDEHAAKLAEVCLVETMYNQNCQSILKSKVK